MADPASILAFVLAGLKTAKLVYTVLSSFKDGPENVKWAMVDVEGLVSTLEQLSTCRAVEGQSGEALRAPMNACLHDIELFAREVTSLSPRTQSSRGERYWKRFKAAWEEKTLSKISARVASHTASLNFCLNVIQSDVVVGIPGRLDEIGGELAAERAARETHLAVSKGQSATLQSVETGMAQLGGDFQTMQATMQALSSASATNHVESRNLMEQILQLVTKLSLGNQDSGRVIEVHDDGVAKIPSSKEAAHPAQREPELCKELTGLVSRLCDRVHHNQLQGKIVSGEARDIIRDLLSTLGMMRSDKFLETGALSSLVDQGIRSTCAGHHVDDLRAGLATIHEALSPMRQVMVNDAGRQQASGRYDKTDWKVTACDLGMGGTLAVRSRTRSRKTQERSQLGQHGSHSPSQSEEEEEVTTSLSLVSGRSRGRHGITVHVRQTYNDHGIVSSIPCLLVYNTLPADSPVFRIVQEGRLSEFQALLREGKASLRDQDEYGASLLFYANKQPEMCRYLIQSGADVNHVAGVRWWDDDATDFIVSALEVGVNEDDVEENLESILGCRKYLLEAGSDPTIPNLYGGQEDGNAFQNTLDRGVPDAIRIMLDFGAGFVNANTELEVGPWRYSPLSTVCGSGRWSAESIAVLLQRNADVAYRDANGATCLHRCLNSFRYVPYRLRYAFQRAHWYDESSDPDLSKWIHHYSAAFILLIKHGADVNAEDRFGQSVSDLAYASHTSWTAETNCSRGDVWDFALAMCGHNISEFRQRAGTPRKARYTQIYTRHDFEDLWAGHEHLCPYYDHEEDGVPDANARACSDDEDEWATTDSEDEGSDGENVEEED